MVGPPDIPSALSTSEKCTFLFNKPHPYLFSQFRHQSGPSDACPILVTVLTAINLSQSLACR